MSIPIKPQHHFGVPNPFKRKDEEKAEKEDQVQKEIKEKKREEKKEKKEEKEREKKKKEELKSQKRNRKGSVEGRIEEFFKITGIQKVKQHEEEVKLEQIKEQNLKVDANEKLLKNDETKEINIDDPQIQHKSSTNTPTPRKEQVEPKVNGIPERTPRYKHDSLNAQKGVEEDIPKTPKTSDKSPEKTPEKVIDKTEKIPEKTPEKSPDRVGEKKNILQSTTKMLKSMIFIKEQEKATDKNQDIVGDVSDEELQKGLHVEIQSVPKKKKKKFDFVKESLKRRGLKAQSGMSTSHANSDDVTDRFFLTTQTPFVRKEVYHVTWDGMTQDQFETKSLTTGSFIDVLKNFENEAKEQILYIEDDFQIKFEDIYRNAKIFAKSLLCIDVDVKQVGVLIMLENGIHAMTAALGVMMAGMSAVYLNEGSSMDMVKLVINKANVRICLLDQTSLSFRELWDMYSDMTLVNVEGDYKDIYEPYIVHGETTINNKLRYKITQKVVQKIHPKEEPTFYDREGDVYVETENECVYTMESFLMRSESISDDEFSTKVSRVTTDSILEIVFVPSKHGGYKGIIWTHGNVIEQIKQVSKHCGMNNKTKVLNGLPISFYLERIFALYIPLYIKCTVAIVSRESTRKMMVFYLKAIEKYKPTILFSTPRVFEKLNRIAKQKKLGRKALCISTHHAKSTQNIPLVTGICSPEACGFVTMSKIDGNDNTEGPTLEGIMATIHNGKLRVCGPSITPGYVSGDVRGVNGVLLNTMVEMIVMDGVKVYQSVGKISPCVVTGNEVILHCPIIEDLLRKIQTVDNVLIVGEGKRCPGALFVVNEAEVVKAFGGGDVRKNTEYMKWLRKRVVDLMAVFPSYMRVKRFIIVKDAPTEEFNVVIKDHMSNEERVKLYCKYKKVIDMLYPDEPYAEKVVEK
ncbi:AMP dependent ligase/synthetase, putative [Entamoeba invadens IP1]|uniref:AMP dependent ligase/synthetase, putative n=1 Tax=Entamoeba invadens IP1 TaxID=370355 RepID=A0A0A1U112_ENTIV|nr:AMP dependent ligase/synthetase, putative [Entamoeba invadens IP1]ELP87728.1 AMP dependent ligase/synthetase, putative [Entamoeba invadens IP1]|eukprot:XP_004254499.1 AMP dependent ligase/synthetase, putative [Entamoeba invadens IP1]